MGRSRTRLLIALGLFSAFTAPARSDDLMDVYQLAQERDPQLAIAVSEVDAAEARRRQSLAGLLPDADAAAQLEHTTQEVGNTSDSFDNQGLGLSLTQPVFRYEAFKALAQTDALLAQSRAQLEAARQALVVRVAEAYFTVLAAQDNLEFVRAEKEAVGRQLEQTKQRFEVGLIAITDVHEAQAAFDLVVASEIDAENQLANSWEALREITGKYHENLAQLQDQLPLTPPEPTDIQRWVSTALEQSFQVLANQFAVEAAQQQIARQRAGHLPTVDLVGQYNYSDNGGVNFGQREFESTSIGLQLALPLYQGGGTSARVREARANYDQAVETLEQERRTTQRQTSSSYLSVMASISRVKALEQALVSTRSALRASEAGLEVGTRTTVDVLNTRRELFRAQRDHARARYDYILNSLALKSSAGILTVDDLQRFNALLGQARSVATEPQQ